jgi:hypothetical protein
VGLPLLHEFTEEVTTDMAEGYDIPNAMVRDHVVDAVLVFGPPPASDPFAEAAELGEACPEGFDVNTMSRDIAKETDQVVHSDAGWRCAVVESRDVRPRDVVWNREYKYMRLVVRRS